MATTTLITGASTGIGYELSKCFAADHHNMILIARQEAKLRQVAAELSEQFGVSAKIIVADLAKPDAPQKIADEVRRDSIEIDYLINNAGFGLGGKFVETNLTTELEMMQVNMVALVYLSKLFLPASVLRLSLLLLHVSPVSPAAGWCLVSSTFVNDLERKQPASLQPSWFSPRVMGTRPGIVSAEDWTSNAAPFDRLRANGENFERADKNRSC